MAASVRSTSSFIATGTRNPSTGVLLPTPVDLAVGDVFVAFIYWAQLTPSVTPEVPSGWRKRGDSGSGSSRLVALYTRKIDSAALADVQDTGGVVLRAGTGSATRVVALGVAVRDGGDVESVGGLVFATGSATSTTFNEAAGGNLKLYFVGSNNAATTNHPVHNPAGGGRKLLQAASFADTAPSTADSTASAMQGGTGVAFSVPTANHMTIGLSINDSPIEQPPTTIGYSGVFRDSDGINHPGKLFYFDGSSKQELTFAGTRYPVVTVSKWLDPENSPWYMAHRGGSFNYPEESAYAYRSSADWGMPCLEISTVQASDGGFINSHDTTLDRLTGLTDWVIRDHTVAESKALTIRASTVPRNKNQPDQPVTEFREIVDLYYKTHVIMVEVKQGNLTTMLNILDSYGTPARPANEIFVVKYDIGNQSANTTARNRGYKTWGYIFDAAMPGLQGRIDASNPKMSMIGMDYNSSDQTLLTGIAQCNASGVRPTFHIINSAAQRDRGLQLGMTGIQVSDIIAVAPPWITGRRFG